VVDEGHVHGNDQTQLSNIAQLLSIERRWIVTGTPTSDLLGLSFGSPSKYLSESNQDLACLNGSKDEGDSEVPDSSTAQPNDLLRVSRRWTSSERESLRRLGTMIAGFLQVPQFAASRKSFSMQVIQPLFGPNGPLVGAVFVLKQIMSLREELHAGALIHKQRRERRKAKLNGGPPKTLPKSGMDGETDCKTMKTVD